ncbi:MAG TPA: alanyl-tRNA editing protein [Thermoanaerobaculaceae bacterium]|nr:alanyl-tRNA editing protein [Thermoanaerobaculaceae bacterium]
MERIPAYERDPYLTRIDTEVVEVGADGGHPFAVLADTVLYPEGGGQPSDRGSLGEAEVLDVRRRCDVVQHVLDRPLPLGPVTAALDWKRRFDHMQQHTGQHLLTAVAEDRLGWPTTAFHLGERVCDIELAVASVAPGQLAALEEAVAAEVRAARPVSARRVTPAEYATLAVRTRGLPAGHTGDVRLVEIAGIDLNTCGGTHLRSTAEIEAVKLLGTEPMRGGTRVFWVAGGRVRARLAVHEARAAALRGLLGAPDDELETVAELKLDRLRELEKRVRGLEDEVADAAAEALAARSERVVSAHFEGKDISFLQRVGRRLSVAAPAAVALLTASDGNQTSFVVVAGEAALPDVQAAGREVGGILGGRGGGAGRIFQGKAGSLAGRDRALARLVELVTAV